MNYNLISVLHLMSCKCKLCCHAILRTLHCYQKPQKRSFTAFTTTSDLVWSDMTCENDTIISPPQTICGFNQFSLIN